MTGEIVGQGHLDQPGLTAFELQDAHQAADGHGLLDQRGDEVGRRDREVDAPVLVEQPLVLRVVDPRDDARHRELLLGQQRQDQVVLVVAGGGHHDVAGVEPGGAQRVDLAAVGDVPVDAVVGLLRALHDRGSLLDDHHVVVGGRAGRWR